MSNDLTIATVTAAIESILRVAAASTGINPAPTVETGGLDAAAGQDTIRVHLLRVEPNAAVAVETVRLRDAAGELIAVPSAALDLHYVLSFHAASEYNAERLLAVSAAALVAEAVIGPARIAAAEGDTPQVAGNDLAAAGEPVRLSPEWMSAEDVARLWSMYPPGSRVPTLALRAGPVVVSLDLHPTTRIPVLEPRADVAATMPPDETTPGGDGPAGAATPPGFAPYRLGAVTADVGAGAAAGLVSGDLTAELVPPPPAGSDLVLRLDRRPPDGSPAIQLGPVDADGTAAVTAAFVDLPTGDYRVSLLVDGLPTLPEQDAAGRWVLKEVTFA